jgi:hypothetical protein
MTRLLEIAHDRGARGLKIAKVLGLCPRDPAVSRTARTSVSARSRHRCFSARKGRVRPRLRNKSDFSAPLAATPNFGRAVRASHSLSGDWKISGVGLPRGVLEKIYHDDAARLLGLPSPH